MRSYNDKRLEHSESSQSDISDDNHKTNPSPVAYERSNHKSDSDLSSEEEDDSSLSEPQRLHLPVKQVQRQRAYKQQSESEDDSSEQSIDLIQQRIKRLEKDLETKIDKHKRSSEKIEIEPKHKLPVSKQVSSPPLPKKLEPKAPQEDKKIQKKTLANESVENLSKDSKTKKEQKDNNISVDRQKAVLTEQSPKKKKESNGSRESKEAKNVTAIIEKKRVQSKNTSKHVIPSKATLGSNSEKRSLSDLARANQQIQYLLQAVDGLKSENAQLKEQLGKKKPVEELHRLKEMNGSGDVKLQKEIQLLGIIESLQAKLKKSISKKLTKSRAGSAVLLHKGLPTSLLN